MATQPIEAVHVAFGDYLQTHAYKYVWCTPDQDRQMILKPAKVSPNSGVWTEFSHMWRKFKPPTTTGVFHLYHIGNIHPTLLGLKAVKNKWVPVPVAMRDEKVIVDIYTGNGIQVPRCMCWYIVTRDDNLLLAVEKPVDGTIKLDQNIEKEDIFMRLYSNAYFQSIRFGVDDYPIRVGSTRVRTNEDINKVQQDIMALPQNRGAILCYVNGRKVESITLVNTMRGDYVDWVYDASVDKIIRIDIDSCLEFNSILDNVRKYLVHYPGNSSTIRYQDDVDMFLMRKMGTTGNRFEGVYLHKNAERSMRMVTHRDYAVAVPTVIGAATANDFIKNKAGLKLDLYIRNSGYDRPLIYENSRIQELYKLKENQITAAMAGINSTVSEWRAENLENNSYTKLMRAPLRGISTKMVQEGYGYNSLSKLLGDTPSMARVLSGARIVDIPEALRGRATVYEYDSTGKLIQFSWATVDETHGVSANCAFAEIIHGKGGIELDIQQGVNSGIVNPTYNYRFYTCGLNAGVPNQKWEDVTGQGEYLATRTTYSWVPNPAKYRMVMSNAKHLAYSFDLNPIDGCFEFDLVYKNSSGTTVPFKLILGNLDLFLNGYSLIEDIDYIVRGSRIMITNKEFIIGNGLVAQKVFVRYCDFAPSDLVRKKPEDRGFVHHGVLSANSKFDLRDDRVMRFVVRGQVRLRSDLKFAEDGIDVSIVNAINGSPYSIRDMVVPMNNYLVNPTGNTIDDTTYEMKAKSEVIDKKVSDYMTLFKPQDQINDPNAHPNRLKTYSPFLARILSDLRTGLLWDDVFLRSFTNNELQDVLKPYEYLLDYDLIGRNNGWDNRYIVVHPHTSNNYITVDAYIYRVMDRAAKFYSDGRVDISNHLNIQELPPVNS